MTVPVFEVETMGASDWVAIYAAALSTVIAVISSVRYLLNRRVYVECHQFKSEFHRNGETPHLKITAINRSPYPVQVVSWSLEDTSSRRISFANLKPLRFLHRWPRIKRLLGGGGVRNYRSAPLGPGAAESLDAPKLPCMLDPYGTVELYLMLDGLRRDLESVVGANVDHMRARIVLGDGRSFASDWFRVEDYVAPSEPGAITFSTPPFQSTDD
ncbi:hypothetical protein FE251_05830 [Georgenia wutianyii]|uniref:Uncharacterized protein n=1 Tax=Georgenia wutianyii TaxID=2585135 RepID=A0ABX5VQ86_9MICO|nr:hypothetical protein [Georgenia wutianyii]QDB78950.1 hypothetical protein FE251_05830 [Georgenia wutianyii]